MYVCVCMCVFSFYAESFQWKEENDLIIYKKIKKKKKSAVGREEGQQSWLGWKRKAWVLDPANPDSEPCHLQAG